jgi:hypothetical protein
MHGCMDAWIRVTTHNRVALHERCDHERTILVGLMVDRLIHLLIIVFDEFAITHFFGVGITVFAFVIVHAV